MLASAGLGATFVTETLARRCPNAQPVRFFEIAPLVPPRQVVAARRKDTYLSNAAQSLIDVMHNSCVSATGLTDTLSGGLL